MSDQVKSGTENASEKTTRPCDYCLMEMPMGAAVCGHCGREQRANFAARIEVMANAAEQEHQKNVAFMANVMWVVLGLAGAFGLLVLSQYH